MLPASNRGAGGTFAFPDVCLTPAAPAPLPIPYPNFGFTAMSVPFSPNVLITMVNALNMSSKPLMTTGDEGGVAHATFKGAAGFTMGNPIVNVHMLPAIMLCALSTGNNCNAPLGATLIPSVVNVFFTRREGVEAPPSSIVVRPSEAGIACIALYEIETSAPTRLFSALSRERASGVILDLRGCPGGVSDAALELADDFLPDGAPLALFTDADGDDFAIRGRRHRAHHLPVAILIDEMTASAAEIFAGILQHHRRAKIFGATSYGKGTAHRLGAVPRGDDAPEETRMVEAGSYRLPDGTPITGRGVSPDVETADPEAAARAWLLGHA